MNTYFSRQQALLTFLFFVLLLLLVPHAGFQDDVMCWTRWATYIFEHSLGDVYYVEDNNYNPLYHYFLWLYAQLMGSPEKIMHYRHWLKGFTLLFDFAGAFWAASLVRERRFEQALLLLFNFSFLYDTLIWEQVDAIYTCFAFGAVVLAVQNRLISSALCFVLALAAKTQAIIFLPPLLLLWVPQWWLQPKRMALAGVASAGLLLVLLAPFIWGAEKNYLPHIIDINLGARGKYPVISMNCYNFWHILLRNPDLTWGADKQPLAGLTYHLWGLLLFGLTSALALWPLLIAAIRKLTNRSATATAFDLAPTLLSVGLVPLLFAFFNTQMHERYWHAAILFLAGYGFIRRDYWPYVLASMAYVLNLEGLLHFLQLRSYGVLIFKPQFVAFLFAGVILLSLLRLFRYPRGKTSSAPL